MYQIVWNFKGQKAHMNVCSQEDAELFAKALKAAKAENIVVYHKTEVKPASKKIAVRVKFAGTDHLYTYLSKTKIAPGTTVRIRTVYGIKPVIVYECKEMTDAELAKECRVALKYIDPITA